MLTGFIVSSISTSFEGVAVNLQLLMRQRLHVQSVYQKGTHRNSVICLLRLSKKDEELRVLREELKEKTARWCTVVI